MNCKKYISERSKHLTKKVFRPVLLYCVVLLLSVVVLAATTDFTSNGNITVSDVTYSGGTADLIIFNTSSAESWTYDSGVFTVTNPDSTNTFKVGSSDSSVTTVEVLNASSAIVDCAVNSIPGTSYVTLPTTAATYTVKPSAATDCQYLCSSITGAASYEAYPDCSASSCQNSYNLVSGTCVKAGGGGDGGGSGSTVDLSSVYELPPTPSESTVSLYRQLDLSQTEGVTVRPIKLFNYSDQSLAAEIPQNTKVTTSDGTAYTGLISVPTPTSISSVSGLIGGGKVYAAVNVGSSSQKLFFDHPVTITIPISVDDGANVANIKVFYYDSASNSYKLAGNGGTVSADKTSISVEVDHFSDFAVIEATDYEIALGGTSATAPDTVSGFSDIAGQWFTSFVDKLVSWGAVSGYPDGTYRPGNSTNRAEMAKIIAEAFNLTVPANLSGNPFSDVPKDAWFAPYIAALKNAGVVSGYEDGSYKPGNLLNRAEALKMALGATGQSVPANSEEQFSDVPTDAWYARYVALAKANGIISGSLASSWVATDGAELYTPIFYNYLSLGTTDNQVRELGLVLHVLGFYDGAIREEYTEDLSSAVKAYQASIGISPVGSLGPITRTKLNYKIAIEKIQIPTLDSLVEKTIELFRPGDLINRAEAAKIIVQAKEAF